MYPPSLTERLELNLMLYRQICGITILTHLSDESQNHHLAVQSKSIPDISGHSFSIRLHVLTCLMCVRECTSTLHAGIVTLWPYLTLKQQQTKFYTKSDMTLLLDEHTQVVLNKARTP